MSGTIPEGQILAARDALRARFEWMSNDEALVAARISLHAAARCADAPEHVVPGEAARRLEAAVRAVLKPYDDALLDERVNVAQPDLAQAAAAEALHDVQRAAYPLFDAMRAAARPLRRLDITLPAQYC